MNRTYTIRGRIAHSVKFRPSTLPPELSKMYSALMHNVFNSTQQQTSENGASCTSFHQCSSPRVCGSTITLFDAFTVDTIRWPRLAAVDGSASPVSSLWCRETHNLTYPGAACSGVCSWSAKSHNNRDFLLFAGGEGSLEVPW